MMQSISALKSECCLGMRSLNFCHPPQTCIVFYTEIKQHKFITVCCGLTLLQLTRKAYKGSII